MILYNQNGQFLGIGAYELVLLGFEDMADFSKHHSDFKELIVEEEGYISASTPYSWLDYIRYSGASDKKILIQTHEDGKRIEAGVKISEVHLTSHTEEASFFYALELTKPPMHPTKEMDNAPTVLPLTRLIIALLTKFAWKILTLNSPQRAIAFYTTWCNAPKNWALTFTPWRKKLKLILQALRAMLPISMHSCSKINSPKQKKSSIP